MLESRNLSIRLSESLQVAGDVSMHCQSLPRQSETRSDERPDVKEGGANWRKIRIGIERDLLLPYSFTGGICLNRIPRALGEYSPQTYDLQEETRGTDSEPALLGLRSLITSFSEWSERDMLDYLRNSSDEQMFEELKTRISEPDLPGMSALLKWMKSRFSETFGGPHLDFVISSQEGEVCLTRVSFPNCDWNSWKALAEETKSEMARAGLDELASKVVIVCPRAMTVD